MRYLKVFLIHNVFVIHIIGDLGTTTEYDFKSDIIL